MTELVVGAHELTETVLCRVGGCPNEAGWRRGPFAYLCTSHAQDQRAVLNREREERNELRRNPVPGLRAAGVEVARAAAGLEKAQDAVYKAEVRRQQALKETKTALGRLLSLVRDCGG